MSTGTYICSALERRSLWAKKYIFEVELNIVVYSRHRWNLVTSSRKYMQHYSHWECRSTNGSIGRGRRATQGLGTREGCSSSSLAPCLAAVCVRWQRWLIAGLRGSLICCNTLQGCQVACGVIPAQSYSRSSRSLSTFVIILQTTQAFIH